MGRQTFLGFVVLATKVLRSTGMTVVEVDRFVAEHLDKIGIRPNRGSGRVTARTVRGWRETAAADVGQYTMAGIIGHMVSAEALEQRDNPGSPAEVRKRVTELLEHLGRALLSDELREKKTT